MRSKSEAAQAVMAKVHGLACLGTNEEEIQAAGAWNFFTALEDVLSKASFKDLEQVGYLLDTAVAKVKIYQKEHPAPPPALAPITTAQARLLLKALGFVTVGGWNGQLIRDRLRTILDGSSFNKTDCYHLLSGAALAIYNRLMAHPQLAFGIVEEEEYPDAPQAMTAK